MSALLVATAGTLLGVLAVAACAKLRDLDGTRAAWRDLAPPVLRPVPGAPLLVAAELACAVGLLLPGAAGRAALVLTVCLFVAFTAALAAAARRDVPVACGCFGSWSREPVDAVSVLRTAGLTVVAAVALVAGWSDPGLVRALADATDRGDLPAAVLGTALLAALLAVSFAVAALRRTPGTTAPATSGPGVLPALPALTDLPVDLTGAPVPALELVDVDGVSRDLADLARGRALLVVVASTGCEQCTGVLRDLPHWLDEVGPGVGVAVVTSSARDDFTAAYPALRDRTYLGSHGVRSFFGMPGTPAAVLLGADGAVATRTALGADEIGGLMAGTLAAVEAAARR
ncbi:MauE/DoxX family redox-associated membrane protein [Nocardioides alkalitolerans]|uniref:MauE/DoxX family redox-associated membrane protein n=1 Tax=Nocardioides alkalitolerans TaxID=281714 RepID=UPI00041C6A29|nr:MauE/DoxX family redox-associated membrane protein [Nocardioides alkalitolerans]